MRVLVLGAGVTGLSAAYELVSRSRRERRKLEVTVLESSPRVGGKVLTEVREGVVLEAGADSFLTSKPEALELVRELGLAGELVGADPGCKTIYLCRGDRLLPFLKASLGETPPAFWLGSGILSWKGKARLALEPFIFALKSDEDESLGAFMRRRLGPEALEKIAGPLLAGIHAGDPDRLSLQSTFPQFREMERRGGILRALWKARRRARPGGPPLFMTLKGGLSRLIDALALRLPGGTVRTQAQVLSLRRRGSLWRAQTSAGTFEAEAVISALPAHSLAQAAADMDFELSCALREIPFVSTATVSLVYDAQGFPDPLEGHGFLVPRSEGRALTAATYVSSKFPARVPPGQVLLRCFLGRAGAEEIAEAEEPVVARVARSELREILKLGELHPRLTRVQRWPKAMPQYNVGHGLRLKRIESCLRGHPGLVLAGSSYQGVGLPDCIRSGRAAAARCLAGGERRPHALEETPATPRGYSGVMRDD